MTLDRQPSFLARGALRAIGAYQGARRGSLSPCRFTPSCSEYAAEAIEIHGFFKGGSLATWRILRCNPIGGSGVDFVPLKTGGNS